MLNRSTLAALGLTLVVGGTAFDANAANAFNGDTVHANTVQVLQDDAEDLGTQANAVDAQVHAPRTEKKFEPEEDNGGPSRTSGAGGH